MSTLITRSTLVASALATVLIGAFAQTSTPTPPTTTTTTTTSTAPVNVGVSPATATAATDKAVPRADVGTVVQTGPTTTEKTTPNSRTPASADMSTDASTTMPPPKTDRN